jgi:hypothetical protein
MPVINFKPEFVDAIVSGEKRQTIRKVRIKPITSGDHLILYTGLRTSKARKIGDHTCLGVDAIIIKWENGSICLNGVWMHKSQIDWMAAKDGFLETAAFFGFFKRQYGDLFEGVVIRW